MLSSCPYPHPMALSSLMAEEGSRSPLGPRTLSGNTCCGDRGVGIEVLRKWGGFLSREKVLERGGVLRSLVRGSMEPPPGTGRGGLGVSTPLGRACLGAEKDQLLQWAVDIYPLNMSLRHHGNLPVTETIPQICPAPGISHCAVSGVDSSRHPLNVLEPVL